MADKTPIKANFTGTDVTSLGEFAAGDTVPVASGGTGATTAADARTSLGAAALAGSASQSFSMLNGTVAGTLGVRAPSIAWDASFAASHVGGAAVVWADVADTGWSRFSHNIYYDGTYRYIAANAIVKARLDNSGDFSIHTAPTGTAGAIATITERFRVSQAGAVTIPGTLSLTGASSTLGYGVGAGGTVTQATSKATAVTLNKPCGRITMNDAALAAGASVTFSVSSTLVASADTVLLSSPAFGLSYRLECSSVASNLFYVRVTNVTGGSLSEALVINFAIIKGATS